MTLALITLLIDAGLLVLIWLVQLVIYPSFLHYSEAELKHWHPRYTQRMSYVVIPLMLSELGLYIYRVSTASSFQNSVGLAIVVLIWAVTFWIAVPLHAKLDRLEDTMDTRYQLIQTNWIRTVLWTLLMIFNVSLALYP